MSAPAITVELVAVLVAVAEGEPRVLVLDDACALPSGPFQAGGRSLQANLRSWVEQRTGHPLGYVEQLYTFADRDRTRDGAQVISISYLGLTRERPAMADRDAAWRSWHDYFPWEDHRAGPPGLLADRIVPGLLAWAEAGPDAATRRQRIAVAFGLPGHRWHEEFALQRYELLYEAALVPEARARASVPEARSRATVPGRPMLADHRRILATAIARLRAKIQYRPVVFELMPSAFTLLQLQQGVEAIAGLTLHKGNFRRLVEAAELVEETGTVTAATGGRPARLVRFRREVLDERAIAGTKLPVSRA